MGMNTHRKFEQPEDEGWLITFADMAVLLMCFFVLLFSLSTPDMKQIKGLANALSDAGFRNENMPTEDAFEKVKKSLSMSLGASGYDKFIAPSSTAHGIDVELAGAAFFEPGSAKFTAEALPMLQVIYAQIAPLAKADISIEIDGHTDDSPVSSAQFPSNWELSSARAASVVRYFISKGFPASKLRAVGLAATEPKAPDRDSEGSPIPANQDLNRRVVIRLIKDDTN